MKSRFFAAVIGIVIIGIGSGCGKAKFFQNKPNSTSKKEVEAAKDGLQVTITNSLPEEITPTTNIQVKPDLNAYFCSYAEVAVGVLPTEDRCFRLQGIIKNGTTETFLVPRKQLEEIHRRGRGEASFEFVDNLPNDFSGRNQVTPLAWRCRTPHQTVLLNSDLQNKQIWEVKISRRGASSLTCDINEK